MTIHYFQGAGHNDVELYQEYLDRLRRFVSVELVNWQLLWGEDLNPSPLSSATNSSVTEKLL